MNREIYEVLLEPSEEAVIKELQEKLHKGGAGITVSGNRVTARWTIDGKFVDVHMVIVSVDDGEEPIDEENK